MPRERPDATGAVVVTFGAVAALLATGGAAWVVLRDVAAYDRPPVVRAPKPRPEPAPAPPVVARRAEPDGSMLGAIAVTEADEQRPLRRLGALAALLTITLVVACLVGVALYRGVSGLG